jgi:nucleoside-diphosphate-sugar epimerase
MARLKILITGASGFIGSRLVTKLSLSGHDVMGLTRSNNKKNLNENIQWLSADLSIPATYKEDVKDFKPNVVIHLSWQDIPDFSLSKSRINLNQSIDFLSFILEMDSCTKILVSGSCLEYSNLNGVCKESDKSTPNNDFAWAKLSLYSWLSMKCLERSVSLGWMRIFYVYGPGQRSESLIPTILSSLKNNRLPPLNNPNNANDYVYIDDVINSFCLSAEREISSGVFNIGTGCSTSVLDLFKYAENLVLESDLLSQQLEKIINKNELNVNFWADISKVKRELNWIPETSVNLGINKTWSDFNK